MAQGPEDRIARLKHQHDEVRRQLELLRGSLGAQRPSARALRKSIVRLTSSIEAHLTEEESSLYKLLNLRLRRDSPADSMMQEHRLIRQSLRRLQSSSLEYGEDPSRMAAVKANLGSLGREIGEHMDKEETILFWLADLKL